MTINSELMNLLAELADFDSDNPDYDVEFIESLSKYYFHPSKDIFDYVLNYIELHYETSGIIIVMSLLYKISSNLSEINDEMIEKILKLEKTHNHEKSHLANHFSCLFWVQMLENRKIINSNIRDELFDKCVKHYIRDDNTIYCRRQMGQILFKLTQNDNTNHSVLKLIDSIINSKNDILIDGIADILLQPDVFEKVRNSVDHRIKIIQKCKNIQRAEGKTCKLIGALLAANYNSCDHLISQISNFHCKRTRMDIFYVVAELLLPQLNKNEALDIFSHLNQITKNQIDYTLPFYELFYQNEDLIQQFELLSDQLPYPHLCSSQNLRLFFEICYKHTFNPNQMKLFFDKITERLRKYPSEILKDQIINIPGAVEYFQKIAEEFMKSKDTTTFDTGLQIVNTFYSNNNFNFDLSKMKSTILEKIFQDDDMFLSKDATQFLSRIDPLFLSQNALAIYERKTDQHIRISLIRAVIFALKKSNESVFLQEIAAELISKICHTEDDAHIRLITLELASLIDTNKKDEEILQKSTDEYNLYKANREAYYDDTKARLDDLILTSKLKHSDCYNNCIAKECY